LAGAGAHANRKLTLILDWDGSEMMVPFWMLHVAVPAGGD